MEGIFTGFYLYNRFSEIFKEVKCNECGCSRYIKTTKVIKDFSNDDLNECLFNLDDEIEYNRKTFKIISNLCHCNDEKFEKINIKNWNENRFFWLEKSLIDNKYRSCNKCNNPNIEYNLINFVESNYSDFDIYYTCDRCDDIKKIKTNSN